MNDRDAPETNPYAAPRYAEGLAREERTPNGPSLGFIIVVTPFISLLAGGICVWIVFLSLIAMDVAPGQHDGLLAIAFYTAAIVTFGGMVAWAIYKARGHARSER
jgi:hypothetical protein